LIIIDYGGVLLDLNCSLILSTQTKSTKVNVNSQSQRKSQHDAFGTKIRDKTLKATEFIVNKYILCQQNIFNRFRHFSILCNI